MAQRCRVPGAPTHAELRSNPCSVRSMDKFPLSAAPLQELHCSRRGVAERGQKSKSPQQGEPAERVRLDGTTYPEEDGNTQQDKRRQNTGQSDNQGETAGNFGNTIGKNDQSLIPLGNILGGMGDIPDSHTDMATIVARSKELGVKTNKKKYSNFAEKQKFIGFLWDGINKTVTLPPGKIEERIEQIRHFLVPAATFMYKEAVVLAGRLTHVLYILPQLKCYLRGIYCWQMEWVNHAATRPMPDRVLDNLKWWESTLLDFTTAKLIPNQDPITLDGLATHLPLTGLGC
ncbi:hypothetical protein PCASD_00931 [Puccinia coronata f. sp. avenae]|uniref:Uncharacterized protein n=1 Tax=Puccinia coronata f. sp. avenae TaxID=200324 RepID=A0A2N5VPN2_9BASI|nr:hypothetical protein PCASD_00931 [Puccinia coronata f. sp. avenae]